MSAKILVLEQADQLANEIRNVAPDVDPGVDVVACTELGAVEQVIEREGPFAVLFAGPSMASRAGLRRLAALRSDHPAMSIALAFANRPSASLREIVQAGADDILRLPLDPEDTAITLERALHIGGRRLARTAVHPPSLSSVPTTALAPAPPPPARVFTVCSATGGCGKTFMATNLALFFARNTTKRVILVDLDLQFGEVSAALRLRANYTIYDALRRDDGEGEGLGFAEHLDEFLVGHGGGFSVLAAPKDPAEADQIGPAEVAPILDVLRSHCDYLIVDTPAALNEVVLAAFDLSEHLFAMATPDLPSVRNLSVFLQTLQRLRIPSGNISLILNKAERDLGLDVEQIFRLFPQGFKAVLPYAREVSRSINMGMPVLASEPGADISRKLVACLQDQFPDSEGAQPGCRSDQAPKRHRRLNPFCRRQPVTVGRAS